jgi:hypothetical protein
MRAMQHAQRIELTIMTIWIVLSSLTLMSSVFVLSACVIAAGPIPQPVDAEVGE